MRVKVILPRFVDDPDETPGFGLLVREILVQAASLQRRGKAVIPDTQQVLSSAAAPSHDGSLSRRLIFSSRRPKCTSARAVLPSGRTTRAIRFSLRHRPTPYTLLRRSSSRISRPDAISSTSLI